MCDAPCETRPWHPAQVGGTEAVVAAMQLDPHDPTLQLAALLCLIPLTLDNSMMQVRGGGQSLDMRREMPWGVSPIKEAEGSSSRPLSLTAPRCASQATVCEEAVPSVVGALRAHARDRTITTKGLVLLGVLMQGDEDSLLVRPLLRGLPHSPQTER